MRVAFTIIQKQNRDPVIPGPGFSFAEDSAQNINAQSIWVSSMYKEDAMRQKLFTQRTLLLCAALICLLFLTACNGKGVDMQIYREKVNLLKEDALSDSIR